MDNGEGIEREKRINGEGEKENQLLKVDGCGIRTPCEKNNNIFAHDFSVIYT